MDPTDSSGQNFHNGKPSMNNITNFKDEIKKITSAKNISKSKDTITIDYNEKFSSTINTSSFMHSSNTMIQLNTIDDEAFKNDLKEMYNNNLDNSISKNEIKKIPECIKEEDNAASSLNDSQFMKEVEDVISNNKSEIRVDIPD